MDAYSHIMQYLWFLLLMPLFISQEVLFTHTEPRQSCLLDWDRYRCLALDQALHEHGRGQTLHWCLESYSVTPQSKGISTFSLLCVQTLILRKSTSNTIGFYSVPFELFKSGVTTLVLQSLAPTCLNTPALKFQVYQARPWLAGSGVWLGLELNSAGHRPSRNKFGDPWFKSISCLFYSFWMFLKLDITLKSIHVMQCSMNWA